MPRVRPWTRPRRTPCSTSTWPASRRSTEDGIEIERAPEGVTFEPPRRAPPATARARRPRREVRRAQRRDVEARPARRTCRAASSSRSRSTSGSRTRSRAGRSSGGCSWCSRRARAFTLIEEYASSAPDLPRLHERGLRALRRPAAKLEYVSIQNLSRETWHFASHHARVGRDAELDWVAGGFGSRKGKTWIQNDLAGQGATSRVTGAYFTDGEQHIDYDTFQLHLAPNTTSRLRLQGRAARHSRRRCGAG